MKPVKHITLHPAEEHFFTYRQTELILLKPFLVIFLIIVLPWFFIVKYDLIGQVGRLLGFFTLIALLVAVRYWAMWYLKKYIITSDRLIHISHYGLFKRKVTETPLQRILNVSYKTTGILSSLFHYGDVEVQVVGLLEPIRLDHISRPAKIKDYLWELHGKYEGAETVRAADIPKIEEKIGYEKPYKA